MQPLGWRVQHHTCVLRADTTTMLPEVLASHSAERTPATSSCMRQGKGGECERLWHEVCGAVELLRGVERASLPDACDVSVHAALSPGWVRAM